MSRAEDRRYFRYERGMTYYIVKRLLLMIPTLFGIMLMSFTIVQFAPGGPVERIIAQLQGHSTMGRVSGGSGSDFGTGTQSQGAADMGLASKYRGAQGLDPEFIKKLEKQFGFDKPAYVRFALMVWNYSRFDFGESFFRQESVLGLIRDKLPVSMSLGLWTFLLSYSISIPLGIAKAVRDGSRLDVWSSSMVILGYAIPSFLFAVLLIILFAGGNYWNFFPRKGLGSDNWDQLTLVQRIFDYLWHLVLPIVSMAVGGFATMTFLTKNSFLDEIKKQYVITARAKGLNQRQVLYGHVFRNAMLLVISGFPAAFIAAFIEGALLIENTFSLDGLGRLSYESVQNRDYPVVFGTLYIFSLIGLLLQLVSDLAYTAVDPRIDFETREV
jgi:microcin C transport system permease protein